MIYRPAIIFLLTFGSQAASAQSLQIIPPAHFSLYTGHAEIVLYKSRNYFAVASEICAKVGGVPAPWDYSSNQQVIDNMIAQADAGNPEGGASFPVWCGKPSGPFGPMSGPGLYASFFCDSSGTLPKNILGVGWTCADVGRPPPSCGASVGNPIDTGSGNKRQVETDFKQAGFDVTRTYGSLRNEYQNSSTSNFGIGWSYNYFQSIFATRDYAIARRPDGSANMFTRSGNNWIARADSKSSLKAIPGGNENLPAWRYTSADSMEDYNASGKLIRITYRTGRIEYLSYANGGGYLYPNSLPACNTSGANQSEAPICVTDNFGRQISFSYDAKLRISGVTDPIGGAGYLYTYDSFNNLTSVQYKDSTSKSYLYSEPGNVVSGSSPNLMTGIVDEGNQRFATFRYDYPGRAISTEYAVGISKYSVQYVGQGQFSYVTDPLGKRNLRSFDTLYGIQTLKSQDQPAGSGCAASTKTSAFDANANKASEDDFNGKRVCYGYDLSRNLQTTRVEGLAGGTACSPLIAANAVLPADSRKISTQWHPDWRLESRVSQPGRITTYVYNGQPDPTAANAIASCAPASAQLPDGKPIVVLCKKVEQATTDVNGAAGFAATAQAGVADRIWKWTYNNFGQVLTEDGPRTDVSDVTTYTYHDVTSFTGTDPNAVGTTVGDRKTMTDAAGLVTQYTKYNKNGQLLESIDPNGVVTTYTYDLRQRMLSSSVGGQRTRYTYDPVGQLTRVTRPDNSYTGYEYDAAHRLVAVFDNLGNRVEYTLDNAGNKVGETVKDPAGVLRKQLARSIDALGRVQQTTGRE